MPTWSAQPRTSSKAPLIVAVVVVLVALFGVAGRQHLAQRAEQQFEAVGARLEADEPASTETTEVSVPARTTETTRDGYVPYTPPSTAAAETTWTVPPAVTTPPAPVCKTPAVKISSVSPHEEQEYGFTRWSVTVTGTLSNTTGRPIKVQAVMYDLAYSDESGVTRDWSGSADVHDSTILAPGASLQWTGENAMVGQPHSSATLSMVLWEWINPNTRAVDYETSCPSSISV
jgi:hypothetical protein